MESLLNNIAFAFIFEEIFSNLNCQDLAHCRLVCKLWRQLIDYSKLWWLMKLKTYEKNFNFRNWKEAFEYFENLKNIPKLQQFVSLLDAIQTQDVRKGPIHFAAQTGNIEMLELLLKSPLDFNNICESKTPFMTACKHGKLQIIEYFLHYSNLKKIDFNAVDNIGNTAFLNVCKYGNKDLIQILIQSSIEKGIKINTVNNNGRTALHIACMIECNSTEGTIYLLQNLNITQIDVNAMDNRGWTAFHFACKIGKIEVVREFFKLDTLDFNVILSDGRTPFHLACIEGHVQIVEIFLKYAINYKINLNSRDNRGCTAFHYACRIGQIEIVDILTQFPQLIDVNAADNGGMTALHCACTIGDQNIVELLLQRSELIGMDVFARNSDGYTAFELAQAYIKVI